MLSCYYSIIWLCYHDVMISCGLALNRMIIVNTVMSYVIKLQYAVCCHDVLILSRSFIVNTVLIYVIRSMSSMSSFSRLLRYMCD